MRVTLITCTIAIHGRWAVGGIAGAHDEVDLPVMRDPRHSGRAHLPGSSLAGSLREHLGADAVTWLGSSIGPYEETPPKDAEGPAPGRLRILGTRPITAGISSRGTTAVDRARGAARAGALRTEESVEATTVRLLMEHEGPVETSLVAALTSWRPYVGRGRSVGLGEGEVTAVEAFTVDLDNDDHLTWWLGERTAYLLGTGQPPVGALRPSDDLGTADRPEANAEAPMSVAMTVVEPIHIGVHESGDEVRLKSTLRGRGGIPYVPGASWKGVFRHRVEFILDATGAAPADRDDIVEVLFGGPRIGRGLLVFHDSEITAKRLEKRTHVAIDRFTGAARDGSLFTLQSVPRGSSLTLRIGGATDDGVVNLINHVLRDLSEGLLGVGRSATRGYGWVSCREADRPVAAVDPGRLHTLLALLLPAEEEVSS